MPVPTLKSRSHGLSLGLFAADLGNMQAAAERAVSWGCNILHFDIMDGVFVPQLTAGAGFVKAINSSALRDVHLMIENPAEHVTSFVSAGADIITVHAEAKDAAKAIQIIRETALAQKKPVLVGLGLMPDTTLADAEVLLKMDPDLILVLSLDPRTGTPPDIPAACEKLSALRRNAPKGGPVLAFDGGVTFETIEQISTCNPDMIVSGSAVLGADNPEVAFKIMASVC